MDSGWVEGCALWPGAFSSGDRFTARLWLAVEGTLGSCRGESRVLKADRVVRGKCSDKAAVR